MEEPFKHDWMNTLDLKSRAVNVNVYERFSTIYEVRNLKTSIILLIEINNKCLPVLPSQTRHYYLILTRFYGVFNHSLLRGTMFMTCRLKKKINPLFIPKQNSYLWIKTIVIEMIRILLSTCKHKCVEHHFAYFVIYDRKKIVSYCRRRFPNDKIFFMILYHKGANKNEMFRLIFWGYDSNRYKKQALSWYLD